MEGFLEESIDPKSYLFIDNNIAYVNLEKILENHTKFRSSNESANKDLNCVRTAISNLKRNL